MDQLESLEKALWASTPCLPQYLQILLHPKDLKQLLSDSTYILSTLAKFIQQNAGIVKLHRPAKLAMAIVLTGHAHLLEPFTRKVWPHILRLCIGYYKDRNPRAMDDQTYGWNRKWAHQFVCLLSEWLPSDIYEKRKESVYRASHKKYELGSPQIQYFTTEKLEQIEVEFQFSKLVSDSVCQYCFNRRANRIPYRHKIDPQDLIFTRAPTPTIPHSPSEPVLLLRAENGIGTSRKRILQVQRAFQFKILSCEKKKFSLSSHSIEARSKVSRRMQRKSARNSSQERQTNPSSNLGSIELAHSATELPLSSKISFPEQYYGELPSELKQYSQHTLQVPSVKKNFPNKTLPGQQIDSPYSMFEKESSPFSSSLEEKFSFKKELASIRETSVQVAEDIGVDVKVLEGIVTIWYNKPEITSFQIIQPLKLVVKENRKKGLTVLDFTAGPEILKAKVNNKILTLPFGFLRMLEPLEELKEWEVEKQTMKKKVFISKKKASRSAEEIAKCLGLKKRKTNTSLVGKYQGTFKICKKVIKLSVQSLGSNKVSLQGWSDNAPQTIYFLNNVLQELIFCFS